MRQLPLWLANRCSSPIGYALENAVEHPRSRWTAEQRDLALSLYRQAIGSSRYHYAAHEMFARLNIVLGVPVVVVTAVTGTALFASLGQSLNTAVIVIFGIISFLSSILAALQTFLRYAERAEQHRKAAAEYGIVARDIRLALASPEEERGVAVAMLKAWNKKFASLALRSPTVPASAAEGDAILYPEGSSCEAILVAGKRNRGVVDRLRAALGLPLSRLTPPSDEQRIGVYMGEAGSPQTGEKKVESDAPRAEAGSASNGTTKPA